MVKGSHSANIDCCSKHLDKFLILCIFQIYLVSLQLKHIFGILWIYYILKANEWLEFIYVLGG